MPNKKHLARIILLTLLLTGAMTVSAQETLAASLSRYLRPGSTGEDVKLLQGVLSSLENIYPEGLITGYYGTFTEKAVAAFQKGRGLAAVGIVGPKTLVEVNKLLNSPEQSAEALTLKLLSQKRDYAQSLSDSARANLISQMRTLIAERKHSLLALLSHNPSNVLSVAFPGSIIAQFPKDIQSLLEQETSLEGTATVLHVDYEDEDLSRYDYTLTTKEGKTINLHFAKNPPHSFSTGATLRAKGIKIDDHLAINDGATEVQILAAGGTATGTVPASGLTNTFGEQKTLVLLVNFQDNPTNMPWTTASISSLVNGSPNDFFKENSFQQTWLKADVFGWYTMPLNSTTCVLGDIEREAKNKATLAGVDLSSYPRYVFVFPGTSACAFSGAGTVGGSPSRAWINGGQAWNIFAHELGHNLGLYHSHSLDCGAVAIGGVCTVSEYGDKTDIMGAPTTGHFNAFQKERLGWLGYGSSPSLLTVATNGTYAINGYAPPDAGPKALKILKSTDTSTGQNTWYYAEFRKKFGFDGNLKISTDGNVLDGVSLRSGSTGNNSYLLDMTSETASWYDFALLPGKSFTDPDAGTTVTTVSTSTTGAVVSVVFGTSTSTPPVCMRANPSVSISPASQWGDPGQALAYTVTVTNNDSSACTSSTFSVTPTLPSGFTQSPANYSVTLAPGTSNTTSVTVTSSTGTPGGMYTFTETAASGAYTSSASASSNVNSIATDTVAPVTSITSPANGSTVAVRSTVTLAAAATDAVGVSRVEFYVSGSLKCTDTIAPYSCNWSVPGSKNKTYKIQSKAFDAAGNVGISPVITVTAR